MAQSISTVGNAAIAFDRGDMAQALRLSQTIVAAKPDAADAWRILGKAANSLQDFDLAEHAFAEGARCRPISSERVHDLVLRAEPLIRLGRPADAAASVRDAMSIGILKPYDLFLAALALSHLGLPTEALPLAERAVALDPQFIDAWSLVGNARQFLGDVNAAQTAFEKVIGGSRERAAAAYYNLAYLRKWAPNDNHVRALETFQCRNSMEASRVGYASFKEYDDAGDIDTAWDCLQHAARVGRAMEAWSDPEEKRTFAAWKASFADGNISREDRRPRSGPRRIFIVGLPRSGTTLIERILVSHSQVQSIGEVNLFAIATRRAASPNAPGIINPDIIAAASECDPLAIAADYTEHTSYLHDGSAFTIDKRPDNYEYIGLIKRAFPDAIIIVLDRNPMDALFGAYKRAFAPGAHGWSYTMEDLAAHYHNFRGLVRHWKSILGDALIQISLEALIADPETRIRDLLDRCGLSFEDQCLRPHESRGAVTTASALQVRQPINAHGVGAWQRYHDQLLPLRDRLVALGYDV